MSHTKPPQDILDAVQRAFHDADNVLRATPEGYEIALIDMVLCWAISQYLPVSSFYRGLYAYTIHPDDQTNPERPVFISHASLVRPESETAHPLMH